MIASARVIGNDFHHFGNDFGNGLIVGVCRFSVLEVGVAVLCSTLLNGVFGIERAGLERVYIFLHTELIEQRLDFGIVVRFVKAFHFGIFVGGSEPVEEMQEGHAGFQSGEMRDEGEIHDFLNGRGREHGKSCLTASHDVGMISEDVQRVCGEGTRGNVHDHGQQFAGNLIHVGNHEEKSLRRRVGGRQSSCRK